MWPFGSMGCPKCCVFGLPALVFLSKWLHWAVVASHPGLPVTLPVTTYSLLISILDFLLKTSFPRTSFFMFFVTEKSSKGPKIIQKGPKGVTIGGNFRSFWRCRWKFENSSFVYTKPSFSWFQGVPGDLFCSTLRTRFFNTCFARLFYDF